MLVLAVFAVAFLVLLVTQPVVRHHKAPPAEASVVNLSRDVRALSGLVPRNLADPIKLDEAAAYVKQEWHAAEIAVDDQPFEVSGVVVRNLVTRFGADSGTRVIVGAHYDASGPYPGADDNASGAAGLLELGRLLRKHPPQGGVELVAYTLEEPPWFGGPQMGSAVHAASLRKGKEDAVRVRGMISLEMIGCFLDEPGSQTFPTPLLKLIYPTRGNFIAIGGRFRDMELLRQVKTAMANATDLPVRSISAPPRLAGTDLSDNRSYWNEGYRAVMVTDTAFYRNTRYHTAEDTADRIDFERMAKVVTGVFAAVRSLAGE
jgi:Zn-dependent M28 family amino/carboxypeptidase